MKQFRKIATIITTIMVSLVVASGYGPALVMADSTTTQSPASDSSNEAGSGASSDNSSQTTTTKQPKQTTTGYAMMTKVAGDKNYKVWQSVSNGKVHKKVADGIDYRYNHIQSDQLVKTKKYNYWRIYVDGRQVGYVNENYFAKNKISVPKTISLVRNEHYEFSTVDAISYATDDTGTVVDNSQVQISKTGIFCDEPKTYKVNYSYGKAKATTKVTVRKSTKEGMVDESDFDSVKAQKGTNDYQAWKTHYGSSVNYVSPTEYTPETEKRTLTSGDLTLKTRFYQPVLLSVKDPSDDNINRVGHIPEGVTVADDGWTYTSLLSHTNLMSGHIVGYDLQKLTNPYNAQHLLDMSQKKFNNYVKHVKVSPYIPIGHGQAMGNSKKYIYIINNDHDQKESTDANELIQIRKSDMQINKIWTFKAWVGDDSKPRYFQNGVVVSDKDMYMVYHDEANNCYEYWEFKRTGDNWYPELVGKTDGNFVNNGAPVQGFTYDPGHKNYYLAFNDLIFKIGRSGQMKQAYQFNTGREIEGMSVANNRLYVNLAQRAELLVSMDID
ncbi:SH3-like domain-containing protein [Lactobacillus sp. ESL0681]|uniref:SH3-like domain-containing protein n=1 Tax=Lactobacillus sp. ESL0681 TaxID=2983211 RepID=UPI0023F80AFB|nr:SH3-like domain-containing protein [Lactobacillus sp. ESL0681]WEV40449.1 SH3-like domain-containing protein [Lactobacillus sp. ESL0681]